MYPPVPRVERSGSMTSLQSDILNHEFLWLTQLSEGQLPRGHLPSSKIKK